MVIYFYFDFETQPMMRSDVKFIQNYSFTKTIGTQ